MTTKRLARTPQWQRRADTSSQADEHTSPGSTPDMQVPRTNMRICCHGETVAPNQRQFQFRNLSDDPRLNLRLSGIRFSAQGTS
jgi:hypothetical protein